MLSGAAMLAGGPRHPEGDTHDPLTGALATMTADLRPALLPFADRFVVGSLPVFFLGSAEQVLGGLAAAAGDAETARDHLLRARKAHEEAGLPALGGQVRGVAGRPVGTRDAMRTRPKATGVRMTSAG